jgi:hypothetical protein
MSRQAQQLLRDAAANLCRAAAWLDPRRSDQDQAVEEALKLLQQSRLIIESVEMTLGLNQAIREEALRSGEAT